MFLVDGEGFEAGHDLSCIYTLFFYKHAVYKHGKLKLAKKLSTLLSTPQAEILGKKIFFTCFQYLCLSSVAFLQAFLRSVIVKKFLYTLISLLTNAFQSHFSFNPIH